ncbi:uncharacterized protein H6S33_007101 [Morchella sextelata]|uniref:uncharacterized protein n=1 Tax=Morchella sextelata TaxID=1174677 RepID=UPI001D045916|nr:uncharacterized protein H6S33_007101 [Morchella sextelata]KAH0604070.1 hypothetical protein H6S33_007101 [Morchella sextelata]
MASSSSIHNSPFSSNARVAFELYYSRSENRNRFYLTEPEHSLPFAFCLNRAKPAKSAREDDFKSRAKKEFFLCDVKLFKRRIDGSTDGARYVIRPNEVFDAIVAAHCSNQHPGIDKIYKNIKNRYYGIVRAEDAIIEPNSKMPLSVFYGNMGFRLSMADRANHKLKD